MILYLFPIFISWTIGFLIIDVLFPRNKRPDFYVHLFLGLGLGIGISSHLLFYCFAVFNELSKPAINLAHLVLLICLILIRNSMNKKNSPEVSRKGMIESPQNNLALLMIGFALIPTIYQAFFYPMGGWDAWSVWNLKARFLFLGKTQWRAMFDPVLWRSSPHYPLLLPLMNVWGWIGYKNPTPIVPLWNSLLFTFLTGGFLFSVLRRSVSVLLSTAAVLLLFTLPYFTKLASSQYCDIVLAFYLLCALACLVMAIRDDSKQFAAVAGISLGFLGFTKPEGLIAVGLIVFSSLFFLWNKGQSINKQSLIGFLLAGLGVGLLPVFLFQLYFAPANQTFINGLVSSQKPSNPARLQMILAFFLVELKSTKWNGLWITLAIGMLLSMNRCFHKSIRIVPICLGLYLLIVGFYYYINTYFEITWWLKVSLSRILFAVIPSFVFWIFDTIGLLDRWPGRRE